MQTDPSIFDINARLTQLEKDHMEVKASLGAIQAEVAKTHGDFKTEVAVMQRDISYIKDSQDKVVAGINKLLWAIVLSVVSALMAFVISGGLHL